MQGTMMFYTRGDMWGWPCCQAHVGGRGKRTMVGINMFRWKQLLMACICISKVAGLGLRARAFLLDKKRFWSCFKRNENFPRTPFPLYLPKIIS